MEEPAPAGDGGIVPIDEVLAAHGELRTRLHGALGATHPRYVTDKRLETSDVRKSQSRLIFSCKKVPQTSSALAACFTETETTQVKKKEEGLLVMAFDRDGRSYDLTCKYLESNTAYRFITGWKQFLEANGLLLTDDKARFRRDVRVELWAFRSHALPNGWVQVKDERGNKKKEKVYYETGHPDGALGMVLLEYEQAVEHDDDDREEEEEEEEEEPMPMPMPMLEEAAPQPAAAVVTGQAEDLHVGADDVMTKDEVVAKYGEKMASAALGINLLRRMMMRR